MRKLLAWAWVFALIFLLVWYLERDAKLVLVLLVSGGLTGLVMFASGLAGTWKSRRVE